MKHLLIILLLLLPSPLWAAIAYVGSQTYEANAGSGAGGNFTFSSGANKIALVCRAIRENGGAVAADTAVPTINGVNTTQIGTGITNSSNVMRAELYYMVNPPAGSQAVATTPAATTDRNMTVVAEYTGVDQTTPVGTATTLSASTVNVDIDGIASAIDDMVVACLSIRSQDPHATVAPDATAPVSTERIDQGHTATTNTLKIAFYEEAGAATSTNIRVDLDIGSQSAHVGVSLKPAAASAVTRRQSPVWFQ